MGKITRKHLQDLTWGEMRKIAVLGFGLPETMWMRMDRKQIMAWVLEQQVFGQMNLPMVMEHADGFREGTLPYVRELVSFANGTRNSSPTMDNLEDTPVLVNPKAVRRKKPPAEVIVVSTVETAAPAETSPVEEIDPHAGMGSVWEGPKDTRIKDITKRLERMREELYDIGLLLMELDD